MLESHRPLYKSGTKLKVFSFHLLVVVEFAMSYTSTLRVAILVSHLLVLSLILVVMQVSFILICRSLASGNFGVLCAILLIHVVTACKV